MFTVLVLLIGGGGGGAAGPDGGGGSGYINSGILFVNPGQNITVTVGEGGTGATDNRTEPARNGSQSSFGTLLTAAGGSYDNYDGNGGK